MTVLPPNIIQEVSARSTRILRYLVDMFTRLSIVNADCDWCISGVSIGHLEKKVSDYM